MIFFLKKTKNKEYNINQSIDAIDIEPLADYKDKYGAFSSVPLLENKSQPQELASSTSSNNFLGIVPTLTKEYPLLVKNQFPRWLRENFDREEHESYLIKFIQYYYEWLTNVPEELNEIDVLYLDKNYDIDRTNSSFLEHLAYTYINSLSPNQVIKDDTGGFVTQDALREFIRDIKLNLYGIKSTAKSFLHVISNLLEIDIEKIKITYPKQYVLRLNGGRFPWMTPYGDKGRGEYSTTNNYYPSLGGSMLNRSVIHDNYFWQDYSYLIDTLEEDNTIKYEQVVAPIIHPAGMRYFFETGANFFNNITEVVTDITSEVPKIGNYALYTLQSNSSEPECMSCSTVDPSDTFTTYVFPTWDVDIKQKIQNGTHPLGVTFGSIYIGDFLELRIGSEATEVYPNDVIADCSIAGC